MNVLTKNFKISILNITANILDTGTCVVQCLKLKTSGEGYMSQKYKFPLFYADFLHIIKYYIQNIRCLITILLYKYLHVFAIEKYLEKNVLKTLTPEISVLYWSNNAFIPLCLQLLYDVRCDLL